MELLFQTAILISATAMGDQLGNLVNTQYRGLSAPMTERVMDLLRP